MSILIGADLVPTKSNVDLFKEGDIATLLGKDLMELFTSVDYRIFNLEVPLADVETKILKNGPSLIAPSSSVVGYKKLGIDLLTLANNHIFDQGAQGLETTVKTLNENNIQYVGVGKNETEAKEPFVFDLKGKRIGVYACTENEFSTATKKHPGANAIDVYNSFDDVEVLRRRCDYVIVLYHSGKEHYRYPSPNLQKACRKFCSSGANLVVTQHSHCVGCKEEYKGSTIIYGQGNFLFDYSHSEYWQTGLLIKICDDFKIEYIPIIKTDNLVRMANEEQSKEILSHFEFRSAEIEKEDFVKIKYSEFANEYLEQYLLSISRFADSFIFRLINKVTKGRFKKFYIKGKFKKEDLCALLNHIECEAHNELFVKGLKNKLL